MVHKTKSSVLSDSSERIVVCQQEFLEDLGFWVKTNPRAASKVIELMQAIKRDPFDGIGKPENLKHFPNPNVWSRRITQEHRLVYLVQGSKVDFLQARYHYED